MVIAYLWAAVAAASANAAILDSKADEVTARTRTTQATYSVYAWRSMAGSLGDWSAEFHSGNLHRVENPFNRIVADCSTMKGAALDLSTGEIDRRDWVAKAACGIQSMTTPRSLEWLGRAETDFGVADRVEIRDDVSTRIYDVLPSGVLVSSTYRPKSGEFEATTKAVAVTLALPATDIFSETSLQSSVVPDRYKHEPQASHPPSNGQVPPESGF